MKTRRPFRIALVAPAALSIAGLVLAGSALSPKEELGKRLFFDATLSNPPGQSCASCHAPATGFTGPDSAINAAGAVLPGADPLVDGSHKPPTTAYCGGPALHYDAAAGRWIGGTFWNGRATGWKLGDPLADQALEPFLNPVEMNQTSVEDVCRAVLASDYVALFEEAWGPDSLDCGAGALDTYERIARSLAAYERSSEVSAFTSKYDAWLQGRTHLTGQERRGLDLFEGRAGCARCHLSRPGDDGAPPRFTNFAYENVGVPRNPENPYYTMPESINPEGADYMDWGLAGFLYQSYFATAVYEKEIGRQKVPTLRNVALEPRGPFVKAYGHNGYFKSLREIVHFYNTRDVLPGCETLAAPRAGANCWPAAEVPMNVDRAAVGDLGLTRGDELALVAFLQTLSDGYRR